MTAALDAMVALRIAERMVQNSREPPRCHFTVLDAPDPAPFEVHWRRKNISAVTYQRGEAAAATDWIRARLLEGYTVFWQRGKARWGHGRGLRDDAGEYAVYDEDREWLEKLMTEGAA
jgi:hypothetical protein